MIHGDGKPLLIEYVDDSCHFCYVVMESDISNFAAFQGKIEAEKYLDWETPYGYGGPLSDDKVSENSQRHFLNELMTYCTEHNVVSQFVRFHPLLGNQEILPFVIETRYLRDTIYMDTSSPELIMSNMDSKNRNMVRKAIKNGVSIEVKSIADYSDFIPMYEETMRRDKANDYYIFKESYFKSQEQLKDNACIFYALREGIPIAGSILYFNDKFMHYHLAGTYTEYRKYSSGNLLLYQAACQASERGIKKFHLGGGMEADDSLFGFKKQFNKNGRLPFVVGRTIFDNRAYTKLMHLRKEVDPSFDMGNNRMIPYRS